MDVKAGALAAEFGRVVVQAMASGSWETTRPRLGRVLQRGRADHLVAALATDAAALNTGKLSAEVAAGRWTGRIESLLHQEPDLLDELAEVLADVQNETAAPNEAPPAPVQQRSGRHSQNAVASRDMVNSNNRTNTRNTMRIGLGGAVVAVMLLLGGFMINNAESSQNDGSSIDADTSCTDFLKAPQWERDQAARHIALDMNVPNSGHPWLLNNVDYFCGRQPQSSVGEVIGRMR